MGSGIVSNLLKMGHTVTVWNRTAEKVGVCLRSRWYLTFSRQVVITSSSGKPGITSLQRWCWERVQKKR